LAVENADAPPTDDPAAHCASSHDSSITVDFFRSS